MGGLETTGDDNRRPDQRISGGRRLGASPVGAAEAKNEAKTATPQPASRGSGSPSRSLRPSAADQLQRLAHRAGVA